MTVVAGACAGAGPPPAGLAGAEATDAGGYPLDFVTSDPLLDRAGGIMRYVRYRQNGAVSYGLLDGQTVRELRGTPFDYRPTGRSYALADVQLLAPIAPGDVRNAFGVAGNLREPQPTRVLHPRFFTKLSSSISGPDDGIELPAEATNLNYEGEIGLVIGLGGRNIPIDRALDHVFGVTVVNDWSENTWDLERQGDGEPSRLVAKGHDSWQSIGPAVVTGLDFSDLQVTTRLNGEVVNQGRVSDHITGAAEAVAYLSRYITLHRGDIISLGTFYPAEGARHAMQIGDVVQVEIEEIGVLRNRIVRGVTEYRIFE